MKLWTCDTSLNISMPVWQTTTDWANVVNRHGLKPPNPNSIVIFDSYYSTRASLSTFESKNIMYLGSVKANNFKNFVKLVDPKVTQSGQWTGLYNPTSHTAFVHKWDKDERIGKKYVISNAFEKCRKQRELSHVTPVYDLYKLSFNACDVYNRKFHHRQWPHKLGGNYRLGELGHHNKFAISAALQNTFAVWKFFHPEFNFENKYQELCFELADQLYLLPIED